jgi:hypothetical protein
MDLFFKENVEKYKSYFNNKNVIEAADKIYDLIKLGNEFNNDDEKMASVILACMKLNEYYNK